MAYKIKIIPKEFIFTNPVATSREIYKTRKVWHIHLSSNNIPNFIGIGECAPLPKLSCDYSLNYINILEKLCSDFSKSGNIQYDILREYPSILFGIETATKHLSQKTYALWDTPFSKGEKGIDINGLIWMGDYRSMKEQISKKIDLGYRCIKLKIGSINFEDEIDLITSIRKRFSSKDIEIRVDANGAFSINDVEKKLDILNKLDIHSIEQPIMPNQWDFLSKLSSKCILPIALDEELIGVNTVKHKKDLLSYIKPQYIVIKPSLHGGFKGGDEWIEEANAQNIKWWVTSALESNIGLNAIAQWCATKELNMPQGLGTGTIFEKNIDVPIYIENNKLWFNAQ